MEEEIVSRMTGKMAEFGQEFGQFPSLARFQIGEKM